jgi:hypothetical protein
MLSRELPVSGLEVRIEAPTGVEDLLLQEVRALDTRLMFHLFENLVTVAKHSSPNWAELTVTDLETLLLLLRLETLGDVVRAETHCVSTNCGARADVTFRIEEYLASRTPRIPRGVEKISGTNTYSLSGEGVTFRAPNGDDLEVIERKSIGMREVLQRCVQPAGISPRVRRRVDRAMAAVAPRFSQVMRGECPECHVSMDVYFDVRQFVLRELRDHARTVLEDVHLLAFHYQWPEKDILALPRQRRLHYANALRGQWSAM